MMTNPLLKVTLILFSLISAVLVGQALLSPAQPSPVSIDGVNIKTSAVHNTEVTLSSLQASQSVEQSSRQHPSADSSTLQDSSPASTRHGSSAAQSNRRSFSFHYLDILEWMFAGRSEKAKQHQPQRPSSMLNAW